MTLPSALNPGIVSGGLVGEGKVEYFETMGSHARASIATFASIVNEGCGGLADAQLAMSAVGLAFPIVAKPDIGWCGFGVRLVRDAAELRTYLSRFPIGERIVLQRFLPQDGEAGLYYVRRPGDEKGQLTGILLRYFPRVRGDGIKTIAELIATDSRLRRMGQDGLSESCRDTSVVPIAGELVRIATIGSTRVGGIYEDATLLISQALTDAIDAIAQDMTAFHAGRFDVRYESISELIQGTGFTIMEVNGAGSEAVHAWDPKYSLCKAYGIVFAKQRMLFSIGAQMRKRGHKPISPFELARLFLRQRSLVMRYPPSN